MDKKIGMLAGAVVAVVVIVAAVYFVVLADDGGGNGGAISFNGTEYTWDDLESEFGTKAVDGNTGISLSAIVNSTDFASLPSDDQNETLFRITADDGWQKNVSWTDLQSGLLLEEDHKTFFPDLPNAYKIKDVVSIEPVNLGPIAIIQANENWDSSAEITWSQIFDEITPQSVTSGGQDYDGIKLSDVLEFAGFTNLENASFTVEGVDGYTKTVNWTSIQGGYLVMDDYKSVFPDLSGSYKVKYIIRITVE